MRRGRPPMLSRRPLAAEPMPQTPAQHLARARDGWLEAQQRGDHGRELGYAHGQVVAARLEVAGAEVRPAARLVHFEVVSGTHPASGKARAGMQARRGRPPQSSPWRQDLPAARLDQVLLQFVVEHRSVTTRALALHVGIRHGRLSTALARLVRGGQLRRVARRVELADGAQTTVVTYHARR